MHLHGLGSCGDQGLTPISGRSLKPVDIEFMRRLHTKVNLIPVIAKADTMTDDEVLQFKARILADIAHHGVQIYQAPRYELEDEETIAENEEIVVREFCDIMHGSLR